MENIYIILINNTDSTDIFNEGVFHNKDEAIAYSLTLAGELDPDMFRMEFVDEETGEWYAYSGTVGNFCQILEVEI